MQGSPHHPWSRRFGPHGCRSRQFAQCWRLSIWKDVPGILNADPRIFPDTVLIPELTYMDAVELAYSGAQIIHPKTIKPLENKSIPLYVRPFGSSSERRLGHRAIHPPIPLT